MGSCTAAVYKILIAQFVLKKNVNDIIVHYIEVLHKLIQKETRQTKIRKKWLRPQRGKYCILLLLQMQLDG